jgi:hypothetical protein
MGKLKDKLARVKRQIAEPKVKEEVDPINTFALEIGFEYEKQLGEYLDQPTLRYFTRMGEIGIKPRTFQVLLRAANIAVKYGVDAQTYVRAQFWFFNKWFDRHPKLHEIASTKSQKNSTWRLLEYLKIMPKRNVDPEKLDRINQERLEQLVTVWGKTPEEIIQIFGESGVFDQEWIETKNTK